MRVTVNGLDMRVERQGAGPPLLLLHGFTGSASAWRNIAVALARRFTIYAVDLVGHGQTAAPSALDHYRMSAVVADLAGLMDALDLPSAALLGYSMGGRTALQFAVAHPDRVAALTLESASPGIADAAERAARVRGDEALARRLEQNGIAAFVAEWERQPLFRSQERLPATVRDAQRSQRLQNSAVGLANSLRGMGAGAQAPVWHALAQLTIPTLLIAGADDAKYCAIARQMAAMLPQADMVIVPDAGHTVHLEQPAALNTAVLDFLTERE